MKQTSLWTRIKRLLFSDVIIKTKTESNSCLNPTNRDVFRRVKNVSDDEMEVYMEKMVSSFKSVPYLTPSGSCDDYKLRFNLANMTDDVNIPIRYNEEK